MASEEHASESRHTLSSTTLFARNLPFTLDDKDLEKVFSEIGPVKRCFVVKDRENPGKCRGFGYITFALKEDAERAKDTIRHISGRKVFLTLSNKKPRHKKRNQADEGQHDENKDNTIIDSEPNGTPEISTLSPEKLQETSQKPKHKPKSERAAANSADGRTIVLSGFLATANVKQLKKACKRFGEIEQFVYPVENCENPTAHVVYKSHKISRVAVKRLHGKTVKGSILTAVIFSKQHKTQSLKSLKKSRLIIRNLPFKCSKEILMKEFSKYGEISEIVLPVNTAGKAKKKLGFAFVQFKTVFQAAKALEAMNQKEIKGRPIAVDWTLPKKKYELLKVGENNEDVNEQLPSNEDLDKTASNNSKDSDENDHVDNDAGSGGDEEVSSNDDEEPSDDNEEPSDDEASEEGSNDGESDTDEENSKKKGTKKKRKLRDAREGRTIFIRNLPFDASEEEICTLFEKFGKITYCKIVVDGVSDHSRGSAFLKFEEKQCADDCLGKCSGDDSNVEEMVLKNRPLVISLAVPKGKVSKLLEEKDSAKKTPRDKRNLYLAKEGLITAGSQAAVGLTKSDLQKRQKAEAEKKAKLTMPHYVVSKTRLCFRNLPLNVDNKKLTAILRKVCDGQTKNIGKVQIMRSNERLDSSGLPRSKGFGFVEFHSHEDALDVLRAANNNPTIFGPDRRPIVEFAIENSLILKRQEQRKARDRQKHELKQQDLATGEEQVKSKKGLKRKRGKTKHKDNGEHGGKRDNKDRQESPKKKQATDEMVSKDNGEHGGKRKHWGYKDNQASPRKKQATDGMISKDNEEHGSKREHRGKKDRNDNKAGPTNILSSRSKHRQRAKANKEEENFNNIVEKYKSKLFGVDNAQLKTSRWFQ